MIRNFIFTIFFFTGIILISFIFLPTFFLPQKFVLFGGKLMGYWAGFCLKYFLATSIVIKGKENIVKDQKFFIAASHQSMFETFYLQTIFNSPIFILKKELLSIPIFGWYLKKIGSISIKRDKTTKDNLGFLNDIFNKISKFKRPLIIFPQGTRVLPQERPFFKKGAARIYEKLNIVYYKLTNYYKPQYESGINVLDKNLKIKWPKKNCLISKKDKKLMSFKDFCKSQKSL